MLLKLKDLGRLNLWLKLDFLSEMSLVGPLGVE